MLSLASPVALAEESLLPKATGGVITDGAMLRLTGDVVDIDVAARQVAIKRPDGLVSLYTIEPQVQNLEQVKVGDRVQLDYRVGVALSLAKGTAGVRERVESEAVQRAASGAKPGAKAEQSTTVVADVVAVDLGNKLVTLKLPDDKVLDVRARDAKLIKDVKAGDQVVAKVIKTLAVAVKPAP